MIYIKLLRYYKLFSAARLFSLKRIIASSLLKFFVEICDKFFAFSHRVWHLITWLSAALYDYSYRHHAGRYQCVKTIEEAVVKMLFLSIQHPNKLRIK